MVWKIKNIGIINYSSYYLHETWYPNDVNVYSKNNFIIVFNKLNFLITFPFKKFIFSLLWNPPLLLTFSLFLTFLYPSPYGPFSGTPFPPLNKGEEMKLWSNNRFAKVLIKSSNFCKRELMKHFHDQLKWAQLEMNLLYQRCQVTLDTRLTGQKILTEIGRMIDKTALTKAFRFSSWWCKWK